MSTNENEAGCVRCVVRSGVCCKLFCVNMAVCGVLQMTVLLFGRFIFGKITRLGLGVGQDKFES